MLDISRIKIKELVYSIDTSELQKLIRIAAFAVLEKSRDFSPRPPEYLKANEALNKLAEEKHSNTPEFFLFLKQKVEEIIENLLLELSNNGIRMENSISEIMHGKKFILVSDEIDFALHLIEQNNLDFFKSRISHLPSQPYDRIISHVIISRIGNEIAIRFLEPSALPNHIQQDILSAFNKIKNKYEGT